MDAKGFGIPSDLSSLSAWVWAADVCVMLLMMMVWSDFLLKDVNGRPTRTEITQAQQSGAPTEVCKDSQ